MMARIDKTPVSGDIPTLGQITLWTGAFDCCYLPLSSSNQLSSRTIIPRVTVDLIDIEQELFELPQKVRL